MTNPTNQASGVAEPDDERAAFEAEVSRHIDPARSPETLARDEDGTYHEWGTALAWEAWQARAALATKPAAPAEVVARYETPGYALAMRVMQSDLYPTLDDKERAECDELIRIGQSAALRTPAQAPSTGAVYLVATGEVVDGQETYTRHEGAPPPLCDFERLYAAPPVVQPAPRYGFKCYSCQHEWEANTQDSDCPKGHCGTTNRFNVDHQPASPAVEVASEDRVHDLIVKLGLWGKRKEVHALLAALSTPPAPAAVTEGASEFTPSNECDSPRICRANRGCCGQYGTKAVCTPHPAVAVPGSLTDEQREELEAVIACLGDDAASIRFDSGNAEDERAANMDRAAELLEVLATTSTAAQPESGVKP